MSSRAIAFGGVVIDGEGRALLREPANHYDGYAWTFPKGRPNAGESPEEAAIRETCEETGVVPEIVASIPGSFAGGTTDNVYFLMRRTEATCPMGDETWNVRWASVNEARDLIAESKNETGRGRDLAVLEAAISAWKASRQPDTPDRLEIQ